MGLKTDEVVLADNGDTSTLSVGTTAGTTSRLDLLENLIAINTLRDSVDAGWTLLDMIDGIADEYVDETGIDTVTSDAVYDSTGDYYKAGTNAGVDLLLYMNETNLTDSGDNSLTTTKRGSAAYSEVEKVFGSGSMRNPNTASGLEIANNANLFPGGDDFFWEMRLRLDSNTGTKMFLSHNTGNSTTTNRFIWYMTNTTMYFQSYGGGGNFSGAFTCTHGMSANTWHTIAAGRVGSQIALYVDGVRKSLNTISGGLYAPGLPLLLGGEHYSSPTGVDNGAVAYFDEIILRNGAGTGNVDASYTVSTTEYTSTIFNYTLQSAEFTADAQPDNGRLVLLHEDIDGITLNTDIKAYVSRDGGTTWSEATLTDDADFNSTVKVLTTDDIDMSSQPAGTAIKYKIETYNNKQQYVHGAWAQWR